MSTEQLKLFLQEIQKNKSLFNKISKVGTANEIVFIAKEYGYKFSSKELKEISKEDIKGVRIVSQDTSPSYNFGENGN
tara:strand:+ start:1805 stop:2038 length:234 start_codon:yes stop_codon:yes gene_type:complete